MENTMNRLNTLTKTAMTLLCLAVSLPAGDAIAQQKTLKELLAGTWTLVSFDGIGADGARKAVFSATPKGTLMVDANGHYAMVLVNPDRPKKWSGKTRDEVSAEDYKSAASGLIAQFGNWSIDEGSKILSRKVEGALNPSLAGGEQKIAIAITGDELKLTDTTTGITGTPTEQVFRRAK
jgi:hypothetical protein